MNDIEKCSTAHHEAGHAVVAAQLGATFDKVCIRLKDGEWVGDLDRPHWTGFSDLAKKQNIFQVAIAGPLSQVKYRARCEWSGAKFDKTDKLRDFVALSRCGEFQEPPNVYIAFEANDGQCHSFKVKEPDDLGDFELLQETVNGIDDATLHRLIDIVRDYLDSEPVWLAMGDVAKSLCEHQRVSQESLLEILKTHGV